VISTRPTILEEPLPFGARDLGLRGGALLGDDALEPVRAAEREELCAAVLEVIEGLTGSRV
jgi:hypothetical protein